MTEFPSPVLFAVPFFIITILGEWWAVRTGRLNGHYGTKDAFASIAMGLGNVAINALTSAIGLAVFMYFSQFSTFHLPPTWWTLALAFVLYDLVYYWKHRFAHRMRWFWMEHVTHHSSEEYNLTTAVRQPWFGPLSGLTFLGIPLVLIGFDPLMVFFVAGLNLVYQYWIHTRVIDRMPAWFEAVMNTPSHHRVHHATNPKYLDMNYAGVFIIWDKMFGTFIEEDPDEEPVYGIVKPINSYNPIWIAYHEMIALIRDCASDGFAPVCWFMRIIKPPGWSPDGQHSCSEDIRREWLAQQAAATERSEKAPAYIRTG
ncbi:sterol desaturase family protein [Ponticaulis sp.]|uniref:sterol desaturase family protein n=1 Tax=Ponticaulis sp. TaxID=2020902 RepID=UPI0026150276|nr:sterol desaturase family protein [Ponticaulis sp.]MDF1680389.1 sterol desaturase family protein [Ponticaulis sp.]